MNYTTLKRLFPTVSIVVIYLTVTLPFLFRIPLFEDETFHTQWSLSSKPIVEKLAGPLKVGIAPLFSWLATVLSFITPNQIFAGKLVSVFFGLFTAILLHHILHLHLKVKFSLWMVIVYMLLPIVIVYSTLAMLDTLMVFFALFSVYSLSLFLQGETPNFHTGSQAGVLNCGRIIHHFQIVKNFYLKTKNISYLLLFFVAFTLALLTKQITALLAPALLIAALFNEKGINKKLVQILCALTVSFLVFLLIFLPFKESSISFLADYAFITKDYHLLFINFKKNLWLTFHWMRAYYPDFLLVTALFGLFISFLFPKKGNNLRVFGIIFVVVGFSSLAFSKIYFPRYTLIFSPLLIIFVSHSLHFTFQKNKLAGYCVLAVVFLTTLSSTMSFFKNPKNIMAKEDVFQFYEDWTSGNKLEEIASYLDLQAIQYSSVEVVSIDSTLYSYGLALYITSKNIKVERDIEILQRERDGTNGLYLLLNKNKDFEFLNTKIEERIDFKVSPIHQVSLLKLN